MFNPLNEMKEVYEECVECFEGVNMMNIIVKETPGGNCIYCPKCVEHHKFLAHEEKRHCLMWGIDIDKYCKEVERQEKKLLKANKQK